MGIQRRGCGVWITDGKYEVMVACIQGNTVILEPVDPVMARVMGIECDKDGYVVVERSVTTE
jgi:hypothetical protein